MTERIAVPLPDGRWIAMSRDEFEAALRRGEDLGLRQTQPEIAAAGSTPERLVTSRELSRLIGVGDTTIEARAKSGDIPCVRIGKALRFKPSAVLAALQKE